MPTIVAQVKSITVVVITVEADELMSELSFSSDSETWAAVTRLPTAPEQDRGQTEALSWSWEVSMYGTNFPVTHDSFICRERLEQEEEEVVEEVARMEEQLLSLRKENRRTMWVSVFIFSLLAALYYLFTSTPLINT